jgi:CheY-like chemotaxis protein
MLSVLAIESHEEQAALLRDLVARQVDGHVTLVDSVEAAFEAIDRRIPNLILVSALMSPRDEAELISRLRKLPRLTSVEVLFTPLMARPTERPGGQPRSWFRSAPRAQIKAPTCAPATFANQLTTYLARARRPQGATFPTSQSRRERRSAVRVSNVDPTKLVIDGLKVDLIDLSVTGAQVVSPAVLPLGRRLEVLFENNRETSCYNGQVIWGTFDLLPVTGRLWYRAGIDFKDGDQRLLERPCLNAHT